MLRRSQTEINIYEHFDTFLQIPRTISLIELLGERVKIIARECVKECSKIKNADSGNTD